jgi:hypothetical protein
MEGSGQSFGLIRYSLDKFIGFPQAWVKKTAMTPKLKLPVPSPKTN